MNKKNLTYIDYINIYYKLGLPSLLGARGNSLFLGLLNKSNSLRNKQTGQFMSEFTLSNIEAQLLSGMNQYLQFHRTRMQVCKAQINGASWLLKYYPPPHSSLCGKYALNLPYLESHYQYDTQNELNMIVKPNSKRESNDSQSDNLLRIEKNRKDSFAGKNKPTDRESMVLHLVDKLWSGHVIQLHTTEYQNIIDITQFSNEAIHEAFTAAISEKVVRRDWKWIIRRLQDPKRYGVRIVDTRPPEEYNRDIETKDAIDTLKSYKKQLDMKILKGDNARACIDKAIKFFAKYDGLETSGTDLAYWQNKQNEVL